MRQHHWMRFIATIGMFNLTLWIFIGMVVLSLLEPNTEANALLVTRLFYIDLICIAFTYVCYVMESCCTWSTDRRQQ